ncbi:MAG: T9SS type A sorting domain-containing protein [Bacteroidota bacterium]
MNKIYAILIALFAFAHLQAQNVITVTDADLGAESVTWTNDNIYLLDGFVFLEAGGELTIEAGTVIKGKEEPTSSDNASALIITRGAKIFANGTEDAPIIFTAEIDDTDDAEDLLPNDRGLWGGLIILGNAVIANPTTETRIEGIPEGEDRALFGGSDDADDSGSLSYVSIRHGGAELAPGDEINGLTLGGVGSGTTLDHIEVIANQDDGIEFFGGTVSLKFASVSFCGDDSYDWDLGYRGKGQFWLALLGDDDGDNGGELDGANPDDGEPTSNPTIYNATFIGAGCNSTASNSNAVLLRDGTAGTIANSIYTEFNFGVEVEDRASGLDSRQRYENGELVLSNSLWYNFCNGNELNAGDNGFIRVTGDAEDPSAQWLVNGLAAAGNALDNPNLGGIDRGTNGEFDPRPEFGGAAFGNLADLPDDSFFQVTSYKGAFGASQWLANWTALAEYGVLADEEVDGDRELIVIRDEDVVGGATYNWTNDKIYLLDGFVFVEAGAVLNIEAGTVIKGRETPSTGDNASALIITRNATINAEGNGDAPIIFTAEIDDTTDPDDLTPNDRGLWGGVIILGNAVIANPTAETRIEGIPEGEPRALFGGTDDTDNSGIVRYVSIRHGGAELAPGDEINGFTLGAVGSGTTLEHIEVIANQDDGIEFFGGTVGLKYASVSYCGDDSYDWDLGYRGQGQFWLALLGDDDGDNGGELDGANPDDGEPTSSPTVYNATFIGAGCNSTASNSNALLFRDGTAGTFARSILTGFNEGIEVEDRASGLDSRQRMENGELIVSDNVWYGFCDGETLDADGFIRVTSDAEDPNAQFLIDHLANNGNQVFDAGLAITRDQSGGFNPLPSNDDVISAEDSALDVYIAAGDFFTPVCFRGAFGNDEVWIQDWTALAEYGVLNSSVNFGDGIYSGDMMCVVSLDEVTASGYRLSQNVPNPARENTMIEFELPSTSNVNLNVFDVNGRLIFSLIDNDLMVAGVHQVTFNTSSLPKGVYYYTLTNNEVQITKQLIVNQ